MECERITQYLLFCIRNYIVEIFKREVTKFAHAHCRVVQISSAYINTETQEAERFFSILKPGVVFGENCFEEVICISQSTTTKIFVLNSG